MAAYLGIDPGRQGALALLDTAENAVTVFDMPSTTSALHDVMVDLPNIKGCMIEKPFFPRMIGVNNAVKIAQAYGTLIGALQWLEIPFREVRPDKWKPAMDLTKDKNLSRDKAAQAFPAQADLFRRVKDDGRAEAALLAIYAADNRRRWAG